MQGIPGHTGFVGATGPEVALASVNTSFIPYYDGTNLQDSVMSTDTTAIIIGDTTRTGSSLLDVRGPAFFGPGELNVGGDIYTDFNIAQSINTRYYSNQDEEELTINRYGYLGSIDYNRSFLVADGRNNEVLRVDGSSRTVGIGGPVDLGYNAVPTNAGILSLTSDSSNSLTQQTTMNVGRDATVGVFTRTTPVQTRKDCGTLTNGGVIVLADPDYDVNQTLVTQGFLWCSLNYSYDTHYMHFSSDLGSVSVLAGTGSISNADSDGSLCIFYSPNYSGDGHPQLVLKNNMDATINLGYSIDIFLNQS